MSNWLTIGERPNKKILGHLIWLKKVNILRLWRRKPFLDGERKLKVVKDELTKQVDKCKEDLNTRFNFF